jgi:hypothetical protein
MSQFLTNINLKGNELLNGVVHNAGTAPTENAKAGGIYFDTNGGANKLKVYNGSSWVELSVGGSGTWQPYDEDLAAIGALTGTSGLLKKTAANTWELDTNTYLTSSTGVVSVNGSSGVITGIAVTATGLSQFASTSSADLAGVLSDETGFSTGAKAVFSISPAISTSITTASTSFDLVNTTATTVNFAGGATAVNIGNASGTVTVAGDLVVNGTTTTISSTTITVDDKNLELGSVATPTNTTADGGGITLAGGVDGNKTWNWVSATSSWTSSEHINLASGKVIKIAGTQVLSATEYTGNASTATTATNVIGGAAGSLVYQTGSGATSTLAVGTSGYVLTSSGSAPQWSKKKHVATLTSGTNSYSVTHGLGTADVIAQVQIASTGEVVFADVTTTSTTTTVTFAANTAVDYTLVLIA